MGLHELAPFYRAVIMKGSPWCPDHRMLFTTPGRSRLIGSLRIRAARRSFPCSPGRAQRKGKPDGKISYDE
jgi:hypothetical protein